jgi:uncharacterized membrane protein
MDGGVRKMECLPADKLYAYLDGELDSAEERKIEAHLSACKRCMSLAKKLEFESAMIAKALRSEKIIAREERERTIKKLAEKRGWKFKKPLFFSFGSFFTQTAQIFIVLALLVGTFVIGYSVLLKDAHVEVYAFFSSLSDFPSTVQTETFSTSASSVIKVAINIIGGLFSPKFSFIFFTLYIYAALLSIFTLTMSISTRKIL